MAGRYKVFLGMAAGVGKTYRMLQEGRAEGESGRDVVVGLLETHGRAGTIEQAADLDVIPRRKVFYRGVDVEEMDLPQILVRRPELCLIDELAQTNAPGFEHRKRYEDIADVTPPEGEKSAHDARTLATSTPSGVSPPRASRDR